MTCRKILEASALFLSSSEHTSWVLSLSPSSPMEFLSPRLSHLSDKQGGYTYCGGKLHCRFAKDMEARRFKSKGRGRTYTEYTDSRQDGFHRKEPAGRCIEWMSGQEYFDMISSNIKINKKTVIDRRHKIFGTFRQDERSTISVMVESDEAFFEESEKDSRHLTCPSLKRWSTSKNPGIFDSKAKVIVTADREQ